MCFLQRTHSTMHFKLRISHGGCFTSPPETAFYATTVPERGPLLKAQSFRAKILFEW